MNDDGLFCKRNSPRARVLVADPLDPVEALRFPRHQPCRVGLAGASHRLGPPPRVAEVGEPLRRRPSATLRYPGTLFAFLAAVLCSQLKLHGRVATNSGRWLSEIRRISTIMQNASSGAGYNRGKGP